MYKVNAWSTGFVADVTLHNTSTSALNGWTLTWTFGGTEAIGNSWNADLTQSGSRVTAKNTAWNGTVAAAASVSFGFQAAASGNTATPTDFTLNGVPCTD